MACDYVLVEQAQRDYEGILRYLLVDLESPAAASRFADEFDRAIANACAMPSAYPLSRLPEVASLGYRPLFFMGYVALYAFRDNAVVVAHIFHQTQDYAHLV